MNTLCFVCKTIIEEPHPYFHFTHGDMCMRCEGEKITVYRISLAGSKGGYIDAEVGGLSDMLTEMEVGDAYTVSKEEMDAAAYLSLPEFDGF